MEIQSAFCSYLENELKLLKIKFRSSNPGLNRDILRSLYLKCETFALAQITITTHYILFTNFLT